MYIIIYQVLYSHLCIIITYAHLHHKSSKTHSSFIQHDIKSRQCNAMQPTTTKCMWYQQGISPQHSANWATPEHKPSTQHDSRPTTEHKPSPMDACNIKMKQHNYTTTRHKPSTLCQFRPSTSLSS